METQTGEISTENKVQAWTEKHGVTMKAEFVPFSRSRNSEEKLPSLNWKVTLHKNGREFLRCDYMQGIGHTPAYRSKRYKPGTYDQREAIKRECETGREARYYVSMDHFSTHGKPLAPPSIVDVLASLATDASAIDSATYEDWCGDFGYDKDSRKGEAIYRQCVEHGLKLRAAVGDQGLRELREAVQDW